MYIAIEIKTTCCVSVNENAHICVSQKGFDSINKTKASGITRDCIRILLILI